MAAFCFVVSIILQIACIMNIAGLWSGEAD
jgi:hypothetical protein